MAKIKTFLFLFLSFCSVQVKAQDALQDTLVVSLSDAIIRSLEISPEVRAKAAKVDYSSARYSLARASRFLPDFTATSAHSTAPALDNPNNTPADRLYLDPDVRNDWNDLSMFNQIEFSAIQPVWTWGEVDQSIAAAKAGIAVDEAIELGTSHQVAERAAQLYYTLQLTEALARLTSEAGDIVDKAKTEINRLLEEGDAGVDDADLFQVQITEQEFLQRVVEAEESRKTARAALTRLLFLEDGQTAAVSSVLLEPLPFEAQPLVSYQELALKNRPELQHASAGLEARSALVNVARSNWYPKFVMGLSGKWSYAAGRERQPNPYVGDAFLSRSLQIGFGFRQNLNFGQTRAKVAQARAEESEVQFQAEAARQLILFEVEEAYRNVLITYAAVTSREQALQISKEWLRLEQVNFDLEIGDTENLVKAVRDNLSLRASRHEAVYKYNLAVIKLMSKTGILLASVQDGTIVGL
jgi:outer membrane protein